ncbi:MAG: hypothetical protein HON53_10255 [Planctomycetaceae bacterium]|nr:hypothetical protein [Planctomycetaceae bacterium]MBT6157415.1 hypothetical protein [Planctomycetaceae bacterium]MBT6486870.1 hypothetical protein [Planctomycetaceae bacterium]MBT6494801.1 hypothetical protein [Planctomycetaceae bacterium]
MSNDSPLKTRLVQICAVAGVIAFCAVTYLAISVSNKVAALPIDKFKETAENSKAVSEQAKTLVENNSGKIDQIVDKANTSLKLMTRQLERIEKLNRFRGATPEVNDDSYLDFGVRIRELLDENFSGKGYRVSLQRKLSRKPQKKPDEYESYEIWIAKRTGGITSAQMAAGIINDSKTVLKKLTVFGFPRPGFDNRYVIWRPDDADKAIVKIDEGQTAADGPIFVLDWLALHDEQAKLYADEIDKEQ